MGIPSFYRQVCRRFPRIVSSVITQAQWLCLDFNCAMYHVLRSQPPWSPETGALWERGFCKAIGDYMEEIVRIGRPSHGVYISCDGVVCAAKRRQQRLRRFKGPWFSAATSFVEGNEGNEGKKGTSSPSWDQNALTPGSAFMAMLGVTLKEAGAALAARTGLAVVVSTTSEPGEGEHKLLAHMRLLKPATCMIYGLDADLILLSMLLHQETGAAVSLLREAQEFEKTTSTTTPEWRTLNVPGLAAALGLSTLQIPSFVAAMSLLGNDFLPRSLTRTVRDDGIPALISALPSLIAEDGSLRLASLLALIEGWAATEEADMLATVKKALRERDRHYPTDLERWTATPALRCGIAALLDSTGRLCNNWQELYRSWCHSNVADYVSGLAWVWDYYRGRPVDQGWFFEPHLPPLWSDIAAYLASATAVKPPPLLYPEPLPEWLHLLAVLPADSVERLLPPEKARLMNEAPWYWPPRWSLFDIGRSQMWECEPVLPIPSDATLRKLMGAL
jgi:5'-3' exonuclease